MRLESMSRARYAELLRPIQRSVIMSALRRRIPRFALALTLMCVASSAFAQPTLIGLGDLPGGQAYSEAWGVSADGSAVVGASLVNGSVPFGATYDAFRWTAETGMQ